VFNRRTAVGKPVGTTWVNPQQWGYYAQRDGYTVNKNPEKWAISVRSSGNILGFVESVNDDGSLIVTAMNYMSGWHKVDTFQIPTSEFAAYSFIH
jgi:surface antigen